MVSRTRTLNIVLCLQFALNSAFAMSISEDIQSHMDYERGYVPGKTYTIHESKFTVLHINTMSSTEEFSYIIENILSIDADLVCLSMPVTDDIPPAFYEDLKNRYAHFYQANSLFFKYQSLQGDLLVASKYPLKDFTFTPFAIENQKKTEFGFFDFVIEKDQAPLGRVYISASQISEHLQKVMEKIESDALLTSPEIMPLLFSKEISHSSTYNIETITLDIEDMDNWLLTTVQKNLQTKNEDINKPYDYNIGTLLCKNDSNESHGGYDFSVSKDFDGNTSARGEVDYTWQSDRDSSFSVGVNGEVNRNDRGETKGEVGVNMSGTF